jgi:hypothetical protein
VGALDGKEQWKESTVSETVHGTKPNLQALAPFFENSVVTCKLLLLDCDATLSLAYPDSGAAKFFVSFEHAHFEGLDLAQ